MTDTPPVDAQPVEPLTAEELRYTVAIARGRVDAMLAGRGDRIVWTRLAEDLDAIAATLDAARAGDGLDVQRRLFVLSRLVAIAYDEMPDRLNNRTRVNVNHAAAVADSLRGHSCGECSAIDAEYAALHATATEPPSHE